MQVPLLTRIANGDTRRWTMYRPIWRARVVVGPSTLFLVSDAEDAVQEIFVDLWKNADRFRGELAGEATLLPCWRGVG